GWENPSVKTLLGARPPVAVFFDRDHLRGGGQAGGNPLLPACFELMQQRRRNEVRSRRYDHLVEWRVLRPAMITIGDLDLNVATALAAQPLLRLTGKVPGDLHTVHFAAEPPEDFS